MPKLYYLLLALLVMTSPWAALAMSHEEGDGARLKEAERSLEERRNNDLELQRKSAKVTSDLDRLRQESIAAAKVIQKHEAEIIWLEKRILELEQEEKEKNAVLGLSRGQFVNVLAALQRMARRPPEALFVQPLSPSDTVRSAILLRAAVPIIERRAKKLRLELAELARTRNETFNRRTELTASIGEITEQRAKLDDLLARKATLKNQTEGDRLKALERTQALANQVASLRDLLSRLEEDNKKRKMIAPSSKLGKSASIPYATKGSSISAAKGTLPYPVVGWLAGHYGQATETGLTRKGITIKTRAGAQVVAPFEGKVVFAGKFRGYGQLLIIEHSEGYHTLLAGLERIDGAIGQSVLSGEPVGIMGSADGDTPTLYVELRRNGRPINPLPWLSARKDKVSG